MTLRNTLSTLLIVLALVGAVLTPTEAGATWKKLYDGSGGGDASQE